MSNRYERNRSRREAERQRNLGGETLAEFHAREKPARTAPGAGIARVRCQHTPNLFGGHTEQERKNPIADLFARLK